METTLATELGDRKWGLAGRKVWDTEMGDKGKGSKAGAPDSGPGKLRTRR